MSLDRDTWQVVLWFVELLQQVVFASYPTALTSSFSGL